MKLSKSLGGYIYEALGASEMLCKGVESCAKFEESSTIFSNNFNEAP